MPGIEFKIYELENVIKRKLGITFSQYMRKERNHDLSFNKISRKIWHDLRYSISDTCLSIYYKKYC